MPGSLTTFSKLLSIACRLCAGCAERTTAGVADAFCLDLSIVSRPLA